MFIKVLEDDIEYSPKRKGYYIVREAGRWWMLDAKVERKVVEEFRSYKKLSTRGGE